MATLDLNTLGEFGLIEAVRRRAGDPGRRWRRGIGDDAAVLRPVQGRDLVFTADALSEGVHFRWSTTDGRSLGRKTLAVNLSDVGAMGARPLGFLLCLGLPVDADSRRIDAFVTGLLDEAAEARCPLIGGDTVRADVWNLSVTAIGEVEAGGALRRDRARPGDRICVTGTLGGSALGLRLLEAGSLDSRAERRFAKLHQRPHPPYEVGPKLVRAGLAACAIDISDGLVRDLGHVLEQSGCGAELALERIPLLSGFRGECERAGCDPEEMALSGGEDFELLFTVAADAPDAERLTKRLGVRVSDIGVITRTGRLDFFRKDKRVSLANKGFEHFKPLGPRSDK
ncbi:MAG: thiamine-phosphate kinase [bacterium]|nr:thiamine-phosphate kinase [bacterium]